MSETPEPTLVVLTDKGHIRPLHEVVDSLIVEALDLYNGNVTMAARQLGVGRSTLYRMMQDDRIIERASTGRL